METATSRDGTTIAFERAGAGPPIILVAGALNDRATLAPLARLLAPELTAVTYDRRGRGDSGDTAPYAIDREIDDLAALIAAVGGPVALFGFSSGGILAALAAARGSAITHLVLYEPSYPVDGGGFRWPPADRPERIAALIAEGRRGDAVAYFQESVGLPPAAIAGMRQAPFWPALERLAPTLVYDTTLSRQGTLPDATLAAITAPTLVLHGETTFPILRQSARAIAEGLPHARLRALPGVGGHHLDPAATAPVVRAFLAAPQPVAPAHA
jgi:pimeloyl-ACP methyl ester carboxylesterase